MRIFFFLLLFFPGIIFSQEKSDTTQKNSSNNHNRKSFSERLFSGGNLGLQFGTTTVVDISPILGYKITDNFGVGAGPSYKYYRFNDPYYGEYKINIFGGSVFGRYLITDFLFAHVEYESLFADWNKNNHPFSINSFFVGGGYRQELGGNVFANLIVLWNLNTDEYSPYTNPVIRGGIGIGF